MKCERCGNPMRPGIDGITFGRDGIHDVCAGIIRDAKGYIWTPVDLERGYIVLTDPCTGEQTRLTFEARQG